MASAEQILMWNRFKIMPRQVVEVIIKSGTDYRCFHEAAAPSGRAASAEP
jgi:hypothetical protein